MAMNTLRSITAGAGEFLRRPKVWILPVLLLLVGVVGLVDRMAFGKVGLNLTSYVPWGLWVGVYVFLVWLEVGSLIVFGCFYYLFGWKELKPIKATVYLAGGLILVMALMTIGFDLGQMFRIWRVYVAPDFGSAMTWMIWLHTVYLVLIVLKFLAAHRGNERAGRAWFLVSLPLGIVLLATVGGIFGFSAARPFWNITVLPLHFLFAAIAAGTALIAVQIYLFRRDLTPGLAEAALLRLRPYLLGLMVFGLTVAVINALLIIYPRMPQQMASLRLALFGPYWWSFWILHGLLGVGVSMALLVLTRRAAGVALASLLIVAGFSALPPNIVIPALATEALSGLAAAYQDHRLHLAYAPSLTEWLVLAFVVGFGWLAFALGRHFLRRPWISSAEEVSS